MEIEIPIDRLLVNCSKSFYWLAKETGVSYSTLWRLKTGKAQGINFATLIKICEVLECTPGDILVLRPELKGSKVKKVRETDNSERS